MLPRRLLSLAVLACLPIVANCGSDDPAPGGGAGAPGTAGKGGATGTAGQPSAGAPAGGSVSAGGGGSSSVAGGGTGGAVAGGAGAGTSAGSGGASGGAGGGSSAGAAGKGGSGGASGGSGGGSGGTTGGTFTLTSAEIVNGMKIPEAHTCDGGGGQMNWGVAPSFKWSNPPAGTMSYAFFMIDWTLTMNASPDVLGYHSGAWNIPTTITELPKGWGASNVTGAKVINGGYLGPCPPKGTDTYHMIVMAMPMASYTTTGSASAGVKAAYDQLKAVALATAEVTGTYIQKKNQ
jgi:phosphatidylethanolamine-binding protein (PEBP) family uncharacterized protein